MTPYQHGYSDGYADLPCDKSQWWDNENDAQQYIIGKHAGEFDAWMQALQHNGDTHA
ncbi:hypothetical protein UFOVP662_9 [uncultured Caudovirales phage]|uniref:Uncharacterized protein n=1 Tax=uncultured Caudovirales phage TaxID=2100421 RepID=A0A6J5NEF4_9CAUD|nr:hypothetical protein UFOVP662_9 [uncultured Caudovirales phage]CAB4180973.1 hypothetical protein UFOVP1067_9 [uncultured Caudovirales phage]